MTSAVALGQAALERRFNHRDRPRRPDGASGFGSVLRLRSCSGTGAEARALRRPRRRRAGPPPVGRRLARLDPQRHGRRRRRRARPTTTAALRRPSATSTRPTARARCCAASTSTSGAGEVVVDHGAERLGQEHAAAPGQSSRARRLGRDQGRRPLCRLRRRNGGSCAGPRSRQARARPRGSAWCSSTSTCSTI